MRKKEREYLIFITIHRELLKIYKYDFVCYFTKLFKILSLIWANQIIIQQIIYQCIVSQIYFGELFIQCEFSDVFNYFLTLIYLLVAQQFPDQIGSLLLQHFLIEIEQLFFVHLIDIVSRPRSNDQIKLLHS